MENKPNAFRREKKIVYYIKKLNESTEVNGANEQIDKELGRKHISTVATIEIYLKNNIGDL